jgi:hypothetical protein
MHVHESTRQEGPADAFLVEELCFCALANKEESVQHTFRTSRVPFF